jgi:hypothetical protein
MTKRKALLAAGAVVAVLMVIALVTQLAAMSYDGLIAALRAHGATVQENGPGSQPFLNGMDHRLMVNGAGIDVFEYRTTLGASLDAARISSDGSTIGGGFGPFGSSAAAVDFIGPPHWFHAGRVLVLYVGQESIVLSLLRTVLGAPFAGGQTPTSASSTGDYVRLLARLREAGATVVEMSERPSTGVAPGDAVSAVAHEVSLDGEVITAYVFPDVPAAAAYAARIKGGDLLTTGGEGEITIDYAYPPHVYRAGSVIVLYVGQTPHMLRLLAQVLGAPFDQGHF